MSDIATARRHLSCCNMVLPLLELPPELQALFVLRLADAATAGRRREVLVPEASRAGRTLAGVLRVHYALC